MTYRAKLAALLVTGSLFAIGTVAQADASSAMTDMFIAKARPNVDYLDRSSRLALDKTHNPALRRFAHEEAVEQTITANSFVAWSQANTISGTSVALGTPAASPAVRFLGPLAGVAALPTDAVATTAEVVTGRSVAEGQVLTVTPVAHEVGVPAPDDDMVRLSTLTGRQFDTLYVDTQRASLRNLAALYADYTKRGDDAAVRAMAIREFPKINRRLAELRRF